MPSCTTERDLPYRRRVGKAVGGLFSICDWDLCFQAKCFKYTLRNLILDLTGLFFVFAEELGTNSLDKIFIPKRLVEGSELNPPILPVLPIPLQDLFVVFCLDIFQRFPLFATMSSDEFKKDKKITPLRKREGLS